MKFYCTQRFFEGRTFYEDETYDLTAENVAAFQKSGQIKRLQPADEEARALIAEGASDMKEQPYPPVTPLEKQTRADLVKRAKEGGIEGASDMTKAQLVEALGALAAE